MSSIRGIGASLRTRTLGVRGSEPGRMLAWRIHGYGEELQLETSRVPALRSPDDVLVRVTAASLNPLDLAMIRGYGSYVLNWLRRADGEGGVEFPLVVGRDFCGVVERAGARGGPARGARVWGVVPPHHAGAHAQYVLARRHWVREAPLALDDVSCGGALYAGLTACSALRVAGLAGEGARGARVLVLGLGGVGHAALQLLVSRGAQVVVGCAGDACGEALARGAVVALDRHASDYDRQLCDLGPYEAIVDCAGMGGREASARAWRYRRYVTLTTPLLRDTDARGALGALTAAAELAAQCGAAARVTPPTPPTSPTHAALPPHVRWAYFVPRTDDIDTLRRLADAGKYVVSVEQAWPWREARGAWERAGRGHARGKLVLDFTRE